MIEIRQLQKLAERQQTTTENIVREYFQHLFLSQLYQLRNADQLLFKGGTALRIVWQSPRFSEDLDFTGLKIGPNDIEELIAETLMKIEREGIQTSIDESKTTSGGYLAIFKFATGEYKSNVQVEISLRKDTPAWSRLSSKPGNAALVRSDLVLPYTLIHLDESLLIGEKIQACLTRAKARDFYDLYFIMRSRMAFQQIFVKDKTLKMKLLKSVSARKLDFKRELRQFLPINQHRIIKGFPETLIVEIERNLPNRS